LYTECKSESSQQEERIPLVSNSTSDP